MYTNDKVEYISPSHPALQPSTGIPFSELPEDVLLLISGFLPVREIGRVAVTCKQMSDILSEANLWRALVARDLSLEVPENVVDVKTYAIVLSLSFNVRQVL